MAELVGGVEPRPCRVVAVVTQHHEWPSSEVVGEGVDPPRLELRS